MCLPRAGGALGLDALALNSQAAHIAPGAGAAAQAAILVEAFPLLVAVFVVAVGEVAELELVLDVVVVH